MEDDLYRRCIFFHAVEMLKEADRGAAGKADFRVGCAATKRADSALKLLSASP